MIIKHLYKNDMHVANAYLHHKTVDIKYFNSLHGTDVTLEFHELEDYKQRFELLAEDERGQDRLF